MQLFYMQMLLLGKDFQWGNTVTWWRGDNGEKLKPAFTLTSVDHAGFILCCRVTYKEADRCQ